MLKVRDDRHMRSLTGLSQSQFDQLLPTFASVYQETQQEEYELGMAEGTRQRHGWEAGQGKRPSVAKRRPCFLALSVGHAVCLSSSGVACRPT